MKLEIFNVEHGQCALLTSDIGETLLLDCGHNSSTGWRPSTHLRNAGIQALDWFVVTNYDEDHVNDLPNIMASFPPRLLLRNKSVSSSDLYQLKSETGCGNGIDALAGMINRYTGAASSLPSFGGMKLKSFCNKYPDHFTDENNLSLVVILEWPNFKICFPGDMEAAGWRKLLERQDFSDAMSGVNVLVASHHGRENGCCSELFSDTGMQPQLIVISDGDIQYKTQNTVSWYAGKVANNGVELNGRPRKVLTTRSDGQIDFSINPSGATVDIGGVSAFA